MHGIGIDLLFSLNMWQALCVGQPSTREEEMCGYRNGLVAALEDAEVHGIQVDWSKLPW